MRVDLVVLTIAALGLGLGCQKEEAKSPHPAPVAIAITNSGLLARIHFSGSTEMLANTNTGGRMREIAALPETAALQEDILKKLSTAPFRFLQSKQKLPAGAGDQAALIRPLLDDLVQNESYLELRSLTNPVPELLLALRVDNIRAELWRTNFAAVLTAWTGLPTNQIRAGEYSGWELKKHDLPNVVRFIRAGDWVLFGWGQNGITGESNLLQRIKTEGRPVAAAQDPWLDAWIDWPGLLAHQPGLAPSSFPKMQLTTGWTKNEVRSEASLQFEKPLDLALSKWNMPTNLINDPLISFTAARGLAPLLKRTGIFSDSNGNPAPDQLYAWALHGVPFLSYLAAPVSNATNSLEQVGSQFISLANSNLNAHHLGEFGWSEAHTNLIWKGLPPMISPSLSARTGTNGEFLLFSLFPAPPLKQPPPAELFREVIDHANLVYYDWEITGDHIAKWRNLLAFYCLADRKPISTPQAPAKKWIDALTTRLGNTVTEVTLPAPNELSVLRSSFLGLTALELVTFTRWEDAPNFPFDAEYPPLHPPVKPSQNAAPEPATNNPPAAPESK